MFWQSNPIINIKQLSRQGATINHHDFTSLLSRVKHVSPGRTVAGVGDRLMLFTIILAMVTLAGTNMLISMFVTSVTPGAGECLGFRVGGLGMMLGEWWFDNDGL